MPLPLTCISPYLEFYLAKLIVFDIYGHLGAQLLECIPITLRLCERGGNSLSRLATTFMQAWVSER